MFWSFFIWNFCIIVISSVLCETSISMGKCFVQWFDLRSISLLFMFFPRSIYWRRWICYPCDLTGLTKDLCFWKAASVNDFVSDLCWYLGWFMLSYNIWDQACIQLCTCFRLPCYQFRFHVMIVCSCLLSLEVNKLACLRSTYENWIVHVSLMFLSRIDLLSTIERFVIIVWFLACITNLRLSCHLPIILYLDIILWGYLVSM